MTDLQEAFYTELKSNAKFTVAEYSAIYKKHSKIAIEHETSNGAGETQAKAMGEYYTVAILSNFISNENKLSRIIAFKEKTK